MTIKEASDILEIYADQELCPGKKEWSQMMNAVRTLQYYGTEYANLVYGGRKGVLIGTHNSATGEKGRGLLSWLVTPFSRCQSRGLKCQWMAGCRYFDLRVTLCKDGVWRAGHGLWTSKDTIYDMLDLIDSLACNYDQTAYVSLTLERGGSYLCDELVRMASERMKKAGCRILFTYVAYKRPKWTLYHKFYDVAIKQGYVNLDGSTWHTYLPIPWLWKKVYRDKAEFDEESFTMVDFL